MPLDPPLVDRRSNGAWRRLYRLFHLGLIDADFAAISRRIIQLEVIGFTAVIGVIWIDELWDLPSLLYGAPQSPVNHAEAIFETGWTLLVLLFVLVITRTLLKQIRYLEGFLPVCSVCKSIRTNDHWRPLEQFMQERSNVKMTHSLCPTCAKQHYGHEEA